MYITPVNFQDNNASTKFVESLRKTGFAVIKNHPIPHKLMDETLIEWQNFFKSPLKYECMADESRMSGYFPFKSENAKGYSKKDLKEFYHYYPSQGLPKNISGKTARLFLAMEEVACLLLKWIEESLPEQIKSTLFMPLPEMVRQSKGSLIRIIHYPPLNGEEEVGEIRAQAHEDISLLTILPAASAPGLQVRDLSGNWHDIHSDPGEIVINAGDSLQEITGHYFISTSHRVVNPKDGCSAVSRYSMPFFLHAHSYVRFSDRYTQESYLKERLDEILAS